MSDWCFSPCIKKVSIHSFRGLKNSMARNFVDSEISAGSIPCVIVFKCTKDNHGSSNATSFWEESKVPWLIPKKFLSLRIKMFSQAKPGKTMWFEPTDKIKRFFPEGTFVMYTYSSIKALVMHLPCLPKVFFLAFGRMLGVGRRLTDLRPMVLARSSRLTESEITNEKSPASRVVVSRSYIFGLQSDVIESVMFPGPIGDFWRWATIKDSDC